MQNLALMTQMLNDAVGQSDQTQEAPAAVPAAAVEEPEVEQECAPYLVTTGGHVACSRSRYAAQPQMYLRVQTWKQPHAELDIARIVISGTESTSSKA